MFSYPPLAWRTFSKSVQRSALEVHPLAKVSKQEGQQTSKQTNKQTSKQTNMKHTPAFAQGASDAQDPAGESDDAEDSHEKSMSFDF